MGQKHFNGPEVGMYTGCLDYKGKGLPLNVIDNMKARPGVLFLFNLSMKPVDNKDKFSGINQ
jgi:hypothetical protein